MVSLRGEDGARSAGSDEPRAVDGDFDPSPVVEGKRLLGRYELVYEIGVGGMAAVYLSRARGPGGFSKWLALKRIHPHLAKDRRFIDMFLDEARIAAMLQHPNVAQVLDLGEDEGEYFIAMEYLHGEHLGAVSVRAMRELGQLPLSIAASIVMDAAEGLHHAHEAKDKNGQALALVHRDVSPQNVFVTYDGQVKLTDFGIAKAANRITHTDTGGTKGKVSYMAPEQALGRPLDRRTDVFALGIVLWEITTGRRLFRAETDAQTLMRITSGRVPTPSSVMADYPPELEQIVMRALEIRAERRYPSAAVMARDLERWLATGARAVRSSDLSSLMHRLFADRIAAKDELLRSDPETIPGVRLPPNPRGADASSGTGALPIEPSTSSVVVKPIVDAVRKRERSRARIRWIAIGAVVVALASAWGLWAALATPRGATVRIESEPGGAIVRVDDRRATRGTPVVLEDVTRGTHRLRVELGGYQPVVTTFVADGDRLQLGYALRPLAPSAARPAPRAVAAPAPIVAPPTPEPTPATARPSSIARRAPRHAPAPTPAPAREQAATPAQTGWLNLLTRPWATVTIDGRPAGMTPLVRRTVHAGTLEIGLRAEGRGATRTIRLRVRAGETVSRSVDLN